MRQCDCQKKPNMSKIHPKSEVKMMMSAGNCPLSFSNDVAGGCTRLPPRQQELCQGKAEVEKNMLEMNENK